MVLTANAAGLIASGPVRPASTSTATGTGVLGFLSNLWHDAQATVTGVGSLGGQVIHDVGYGAASLVDPLVPGKGIGGGGTFFENTDPTGLHLGKIAQALPGAVVHDYAHRYGGVSNIKTGLYQHPLSYILDALAVGSTVGKGAEIVGALSLKTPSAVDALAAGEEAADTLRAAGVAEKSAKAAGLKVGLEKLGEQTPLTGLQEAAMKVLPSVTARKVGESLVPFAESNNPVARGMLYPLKRLASEPIDVIKGQAEVAFEAVNSHVAAGDVTSAEYTKALTRYDQLKGLVSGAEQYGMTRIQRPIVSDIYEKLAVKKLLGYTRGMGYSKREARIGEVVGNLKPYYSQDANFVDRAAGVYQGLDVTIPELPQRQAVNLDHFIMSPKEVPLVNPLDAAPPVTDIPPEMRQWVSENSALSPKLAKADYAKEQAGQILQQAATNPDRLRMGQTLASEQDAASRYIAGHYDAISRTVEHISPSDFTLADTIRSQDDLRIMLAGPDWQGGMLDQNVISYNELMDRTYRSSMMKHGAEYFPTGEGGAGELRYVPDGVDSSLYHNGTLDPSSLQKADWRQLDDAFRAANAPQPIYYPQINADTLGSSKYSDFVMSNARVGARRATADPNLKWMEGDLLKSGDYITDPIQAYVRRAARMSRSEELQNLMQWAIKPQGRLISSLDEKLNNESYYIPDGMHRFWRTKIGFEDTVDNMSSGGADMQPSVRDALHSVMFKNQDEIVNAGVTTKGVEIYAIPKNLADGLDAYAKYAINNKFVRFFYDGPMNAWRGMVLQGSPRWTFNNLLGNTTLAKLSGGVNLTDAGALLVERFKQMLNDKFGANFDTALLDRVGELPGIGRVDAGGYATDMNLYNPKLGSLGESRGGQMYEKVSGSPPVRAAKWLGTKNQRANGAIEDAFREAGYVKALEKQDLIKGVMPHIDGWWNLRKRLDALNGRTLTQPQVDSAITEMGKVMGNFTTSLGPFERNVVRRFIFPFWGFMKHQAQFLARMPGNNPYRSTILRLSAQINQEMLAQYGPIPGWLEGAVPMAGPGSGQIPFISTRGPNPFSGTFQPPTSQLSPLLQLALSRSGGRDLFTGNKYSDPNVTYPYGSDTPYRKVYDANGNVVDVQPLSGPVVPALLEQLLSTIPQYQALEGIAAGGKPYDSANLPSIIAARLRDQQGKATPVDPATGQPYTPASVTGELAKLSGVGSYSVDLQSLQMQQALEKLRALSAAR